LYSQTVLLEDLAVAPFIVSSFGLFVLGLFANLFTAPSWQTFTLLAYGWAVASGERQTITTYMWLSGATSVKQFSCFSLFLGGALYQARWQLWARIIRCAGQWVPAEAVIVLIVDDSTKKKAGRQIEGVGHYRNGAGSARQEYRTLRGLNFVWGLMRVPVPGWPGQQVSVPIGLSLYLKEEQADKLQLPYQTRSALAREIADFVAAQLPTRQIRVLGDGGYASKESLHQLPATVDVVSRMLITGKLYALPAARVASRRGCPPKKGPLLGSPKTLARKRSGWQPHPTEAGVLVQTWDGLWHTVLPGRLIRVAVVRRPRRPRARKPGQRKPLPPVEAFFTTDLTLSLEAILAQYRERWAVEIIIRDSNAFTGLGQDQCRKHERVVGANTLRLVLAAARTLWFMAQIRPATPLPLQRYRPWYRQKCAPSQLDILWAWREALHAAGVFPIPRFAPGLAEIPQEFENTLPLAA
jgi:DDE superfamily endonuclease/Archaeal putative transposase ISC1217